MDEEAPMSRQFQVRAIPSFFIMRGLNVMGGVTGADMKRLEAQINQQVSQAN